MAEKESKRGIVKCLLSAVCLCVSLMRLVLPAHAAETRYVPQIPPFAGSSGGTVNIPVDRESSAQIKEFFTTFYEGPFLVLVDQKSENGYYQGENLGDDRKWALIFAKPDLSHSKSGSFVYSDPLKYPSTSSHPIRMQITCEMVTYDYNFTSGKFETGSYSRSVAYTQFSYVIGSSILSNKANFYPGYRTMGNQFNFEAGPADIGGIEKHYNWWLAVGGVEIPDGGDPGGDSSSGGSSSGGSSGGGSSSGGSSGGGSSSGGSSGGGSSSGGSSSGGSSGGGSSSGGSSGGGSSSGGSSGGGSSSGGSSSGGSSGGGSSSGGSSGGGFHKPGEPPESDLMPPGGYLPDGMEGDFGFIGPTQDPSLDHFDWNFWNPDDHQEGALQFGDTLPLPEATFPDAPEVVPGTVPGTADPLDPGQYGFTQEKKDLYYYLHKFGVIVS